MELVTERLILREFKGRWWDTLLYAILEDEWREQARPRVLHCVLALIVRCGKEDFRERFPGL